MTIIFNSIKEIRTGLGLKLEQVSKKSGQKVSSLCDMENRELKHKVSLRNIDLFSNLMGFKLEYYYLNRGCEYKTLKELRESLNLSLRASSKIIGKSYSSICEIESREKSRQVTIQTLQKISNSLGARFEYFYKPSRKITDLLHQKSIYNASYKIISDELNKKNMSNELSQKDMENYVLKVTRSVIKGDRTMKLYHPIKDLSCKLLLNDYLDW